MTCTNVSTYKPKNLVYKYFNYHTHQLHYQSVSALQQQAWCSQGQTCQAKLLAAGRHPRLHQ